MNTNTQERKKVLIQTVGTGGPKNPVWQALAFVCHQQQPDVLVQICSQQTLEETIPKFLELWQPSPTTKVERHIVRDANDVESLIFELLGITNELRRQYPDAELLVDFTSGTKPMSAAAVAVAIGQQANTMLYAIGPRDESGRVTETTGVASAATDQVYAERLLDELGRLFDQGQFRAVCDQAWPLVLRLNNDQLRAKASSLWYLADVYQHWNLFQYERAYARLRCRASLNKCGDFTPDKNARRLLPDALAKAGWDTQLVDRQFEFVTRCKEKNDVNGRLVDLWANAARCFVDGRFDDAVARLYRLIEYVCQVRYCSHTGKELARENPTSNVPFDEVRNLAPNFVAHRMGDEKPEKVNLGLNDLIWVLAEAGDEVGVALRAECQMESKANKGELGELLQRRNNSLLGHGTTPLDQQTAERLLDKSREYLKQHVEREPQAEDFEPLLHVARFVRCPWVSNEVP